MKRVLALTTLTFAVALPLQATENYHDDRQLLVKSIQQLQMGATPERMDANFRFADTNKDGVLNRFEAGKVPGLAVEFNNLDRDRSRTLDRAEFDNLLNLSTTNAMMSQGWHHGRKAGGDDR